MHKDLDKECQPCEYRLDEQAIEKIIRKWPKEWKFPIIKGKIWEEEASREVWKEALKKSNVEEKTQWKHRQQKEEEIKDILSDTRS